MTDIPITGLRRPPLWAWRRRWPDMGFAWLMTLPAVLLTLALLAYPLLYSAWVSLHEVELGARTAWPWVGLDNYRSVLQDPLFWPTVIRTLVYSAAVIAGTIVLAMVFALLLTEDFRGRGILRAMLILPWALSQITLALTFGWIFNSTFGPLNGLLYDLHLIHHYVAWFATGTSSLAIIALALVWGLVPFASLLFLGALQTVPEDLHRAARVDGAGPVRRFFSITLPWIGDTVVVVVVIAALNAFLAFALIYVLTGGGPGTETTVLAWWGYKTAFQDLDLGRGAAIFYVMTVIVAALAAVTVLSLRRLVRR
jgi:multiple sugar transport system permease protein